MPQFMTFQDYDMNPSPQQIQAIYESGFPGLVYNPFNKATMLGVENIDFYTAFPMARDIGKNKLSAPYRAALVIEPAFGEYEAQTTGDCVSHETRNGCSIDFYCDIFFGETKIPKDAAKPRLATEHIYGMRQHGGEGADPYLLANSVSPEGKGGLLIRKKYTSPNGDVVDLSTYNSSIGARWGSRGVPQWLLDIAVQNKALRVIPCKSLAQARDALALGFGIGRGSWMSFSSSRTADGSAERTRQGWSHAESWIGFDHTLECQKKYGETGQPLEQNSWGPWNGGPTRYEQPVGSYWMMPKDAQRMIDDGEVWIYCSIRGYDRELVYDRHKTLFTDLYSVA